MGGPQHSTLHVAGVMCWFWSGPKSSGAGLASADVDSVFLVLCEFHCLFLTIIVKTLVRELPLIIKGSFPSLAAEYLIRISFSRLRWCYLRACPCTSVAKGRTIMMSPGWSGTGFCISELIPVKQVLLPGGFLADELWNKRSWVGRVLIEGVGSECREFLEKFQEIVGES